MGKAIVFDGNSILNRAFYGIRPLTSPDGMPTNALYGFVGIINKSLSQIGGSPDYAAIAFDLREKTFRHLKTESYKATRKAMPDELAAQMPCAHELASALGLKVLELAGYEADDILGTLSEMCGQKKDACYIVTGDRDSFQLVNESVTVLLASNDETKVVTPAFIEEKYGVPPKSLIDVKALMGDSSDNIRGVPGIGEKGALSLIQKYKSLDGVYEHIEEIGGSLRGKLESGKESAYESRFLASIVLDVPLGIKQEDIAYRGYDVKTLSELYRRLGFRKYLESLPMPAEDSPEALFAEITPLGDEIPGNENDTLFLHYDGEEIFVCSEGSCFSVKKSDAGRLLKAKRHFVCWSAKEIIILAHSLGISFSGFDDLSLMAYVRSPADNGVVFGKICLELLSQTSKEVNISLLPALYEKLREGLSDGLTTLYRDIELPLCSVLAGMEERGFRVSREELERFSEGLSRDIAQAEEAIYSLAGEEFNINSTKQLGEILFEKLRLPHFRKTKSGYSTDASVLEKLEPYSPIIPLILGYRRDAKLKSTYCDGLSKQISDDGRIHTTFKQTQTLTGRLSSAEPNLQNIPVRGEKGREIRKFFVAGDGCVLIDADYSQIELRILAHVSGDERLINAFLSGEDIHTVTASQVFGVPLDCVTPEMRKKAKAVNFGIIYGIGDYSLSQDIHVTRRAAAEYIESYLSKYPSVREYLDSAKRDAYKNGYVTTMFGRRRYIPELASKNANLRAFGERVAMNTPIQGSAADLIKIAMIRTEKMLSDAGLASRLILQIHDELIIEAPESERERAAEILREAMTGGQETKVPLEIDIGFGKSWYDAKKD